VRGGVTSPHHRQEQLPIWRKTKRLLSQGGGYFWSKSSQNQKHWRRISSSKNKTRGGEEIEKLEKGGAAGTIPHCKEGTEYSGVNAKEKEWKGSQRKIGG